MNELTRFIKKSFTNKGYFLAALDISFLPPFLIALAFLAFPPIFQVDKVDVVGHATNFWHKTKL
jgi:hypothetical protein